MIYQRFLTFFSVFIILLLSSVGALRKIVGKSVLTGLHTNMDLQETSYPGNGANNASAWEEKDYTLVFCRRDSSDGRKEILLGMKKRGFGMGKWNGFGGKLEGTESIEECARRELLEECGLLATSLQRMGYLCFKMLESSKIMRVHVYQTRQFERELVESDEMRPQWYFEDELPFQHMWPDDAHWMPLLLSDKQFVGR